MIIGSFAGSLVNFRGQLLKALVKLGHEVVGCAPNADGGVRNKLAQMGVHYAHIPLSRTGLNPLKDTQTFLALFRIFLKIRPDCLLAYTAKPVIYSCFAARLLGLPKVYAMITGLGYGFGHETRKQRLVGVVIRQLYREALKGASGILFQNRDDRDLFTSLSLIPRNTETTIVNGSGVDLLWYTPQPLPAGPSFLLIARLLVEKGVREYIRAARRLREKYPHIIFRIAGYCDTNPASIKLQEVKGWVAEGVIEYLGELEDVRPALGECMVYVLPSYREGTPRTVLEAMAIGRPVITTDTSGCRETVIDGLNGFLVPVRDSIRLENAMERFILSPELAAKMGIESRRVANEKYDVNRINDVIMNAMGIRPNVGSIERRHL